MTRRLLVFVDGTKYELSPFSTSEDASDSLVKTMMDAWEDRAIWCGANDIAYREFLRHNNLYDEDEFSSDNDAVVEEVAGETAIDWDATYGNGCECERCKLGRQAVSV